eukprot:642039-Pelagomonas_calceolata.AAC.5
MHDKGAGHAQRVLLGPRAQLLKRWSLDAFAGTNTGRTAAPSWWLRQGPQLACWLQQAGASGGASALGS